MGRPHPRSIKFIDLETKSDRELIKWIKHYPVIYDKKYAVSISAKEIKEIWEHIGYNLQRNAKQCEDRWEVLLKEYKEYRTFSSTMNEVLIELMDEMNIIPKNINNYGFKEKNVTANPRTFQGNMDFHYMRENEILENNNCCCI